MEPSRLLPLLLLRGTALPRRGISMIYMEVLAFSTRLKYTEIT